MKFRYVGTDAQEAEIGSIHDFDENPNDARWEPATKKHPAKAETAEETSE